MAGMQVSNIGAAAREVGKTFVEAVLPEKTIAGAILGLATHDNKDLARFMGVGLVAWDIIEGLPPVMIYNCVKRGAQALREGPPSEEENADRYFLFSGQLF